MEMVLDVVALLDRINKLENETKELRGIVKDVRKELADGVEEAKQISFDQIPKISPEGKLVIETYDDAGNTVYGHVVAEIKTDDQPVAS